MNNIILNYKLIGIGEFSHGIQESWQFNDIDPDFEKKLCANAIKNL